MAKQQQPKPDKKAKDETPGQPPPLGHNLPTEEDRQRLFFNWRKKWDAAKAAVAEATASLKEIETGAKGEIGAHAVKSFKDAAKLLTPEGEAEIKATIERQMEIARWLAIPLGSQMDLFPVNRTPSVDKAEAEGLRDSLEGKFLKNPYAPDLPQHARYAEGWHKGQAKNSEGIKAPADDADLRPGFLRNGGGEAAAA